MSLSAVSTSAFISKKPLNLAASPSSAAASMSFATSTYSPLVTTSPTSVGASSAGFASKEPGGPGTVAPFVFVEPAGAATGGGALEQAEKNVQEQIRTTTCQRCNIRHRHERDRRGDILIAAQAS